MLKSQNSILLQNFCCKSLDWFKTCGVTVIFAARCLWSPRIEFQAELRTSCKRDTNERGSVTDCRGRVPVAAPAPSRSAGPVSRRTWRLRGAGSALRPRRVGDCPLPGGWGCCTKPQCPLTSPPSCPAAPCPVASPRKHEAADGTCFSPPGTKGMELGRAWDGRGPASTRQCGRDVPY